MDNERKENADNIESKKAETAMTDPGRTVIHPAAVKAASLMMIFSFRTQKT